MMLLAPEHWHPILVHFTFALLFLAPFFFLVSMLGPDHGWGKAMLIAGRAFLWTGVLITAITIWAGFIAMWHADVGQEVHHHIHDHRNWAIGTAIAFVLLGIWSFIDWKRGMTEGWLFVILSFAALGLLVVTGYKGGELVFKHGVNVHSSSENGNPNQSRQDGAEDQSSGGHSH